jgi:1-deoxy-D-xylulose-5-phosphate reductoisomerase
MVVAGELINELAIKHQVPILPVDSEHSAIFQCLAGENDNKIEKIILTASGGPFRTFSKEQLENVTKEQALKHPNWSMGAKITIDSASMMNKGLEVIEAKWLFGVRPEDIEVVVHPQSVIHSMVQFTDGAVKAQLGTPDMRLPIMYALSYPTRLPSSFERLNFATMKELTFEQPDTERFPNLQLAYHALTMGGNMPCVLNAANEVCVAAFLSDKIKFTEMSRLIERAMQSVDYRLKPTLDNLFDTDKQTRQMVKGWI